MQTADLTYIEKTYFQKAKAEDLVDLQVVSQDLVKCRTVVTFTFKPKTRWSKSPIPATWTFDLPITLEGVEDLAQEVFDTIKFEIQELEEEGHWAGG